MHTIGGAQKTQEVTIPMTTTQRSKTICRKTIPYFTQYSATRRLIIVKKELCSITACVCINKFFMKSYYYKGSKVAEILTSMAVSLAVFKTRCDLCPSEFNTTTALLRHREAKHHIDAHSVTFLPFYNGQEVIRLPSRIRRGRRSSSYKQWISGIVDSINSCLHPKAAGKNACIYFPSISSVFTTVSKNFCVAIE